MSGCCCCHSEAQETEKKHDCNCAGQEIDVLGKTANASVEFDGIVELIDSGKETFAMLENHRLTDSARAMWNLHKEVVDATMAGGWDNKTHPWYRELQDFWRYALAFCDYGMLSLAMIEPELKDEICDYARKTVLLLKDTPIWDEWVRFGFNDNPITKDNIMYKGHLHFVYGVYQLLSGSTEFEKEYQFLTELMLREYDANSVCETPYWGIVCEPDQYFPQCNSVALVSMKIYDLIYGTNLKEEYGDKIYEFIFDRISDKDTGLLFAKYHPSHDQGEPYITGFCNAWGLNLLHSYSKERLDGAYKTFIKNFGKEMMGGSALYIKEYASFDEASTLTEESMGVFYSMALAKEYDDVESWEKFARYFTGVYGIEIEDGVARMKKASPMDETFVHNYILWGQIHQPWEKVFAYDWEGFRKGDF